MYPGIPVNLSVTVTLVRSLQFANMYVLKSTGAAYVVVPEVFTVILGAITLLMVTLFKALSANAYVPIAVTVSGITRFTRPL